MPSFQERIHGIKPDCNARQVEGVMRSERNGSLDQMTDDEFYELCLASAEKAQGDPRRAEELADSYRLRREAV